MRHLDELLASVFGLAVGALIYAFGLEVVFAVSHLFTTEPKREVIRITDGESGFVVYGECAPFPCESNLWSNARMNDPQAWKEAANE